MKVYSGVLLKESLKELDVLADIQVVEISTQEETNPTAEQARIWTWYRIQVAEEKLQSISERLSSALKERAWYTNLWTEGDYLLIFPNRIFRGSSVDDPVWSKAIEYGTSIGVPIAQLTPIEHVLHTR